MSSTTTTTTTTTVFNTGPEKDLSPGLHNFVVVLAFIFLAIWAWKTLRRFAHQSLLSYSLKHKNLVRLDTLTNHVRSMGAITRDHVRELMISRSIYTTERAQTVRMECQLHTDTFRLRPHATEANVWIMTVVVSTTTTCVIKLLYGLRYSSMQKLYAERYGKGSNRRGSGKHKNKKTSNNNNNSNHELSSQAPQPQPQPPAGAGIQEDANDYGDGGGGDEVFPPNSWMGGHVVATVLSGIQQEVDIEVDADLLVQCMGRMSSFAYPLTIWIHPVLNANANANDDGSGLNRCDANVSAMLSMLQLSESPRSPRSNNNNNSNNDSGNASPASVAAAAVGVGGNDEEEAALPSVRLAIQAIMSSEELLELQPIYGIDDKNEEDCTVCLTEKKDIVPLPCRHCCVCRSCFEHIQNKCPVCRAQISSFLRFELEANYNNNNNN